MEDKLDNSMVFGFLYLYQFLVAVYCSTIVCGVDTFLFSSLTFLKYQMRILGYRLSKCGNREKINRQASEYKELIDLIKMHIHIKE